MTMQAESLLPVRHPARQTGNARKSYMKLQFKFIKPGKLVDGDLQLVLVGKHPANPVKKYVPCYEFEMRKTGGSRKIGSVRLRIGRTRPLIGWGGHIGYGVDKKYRGHHYAARSCLLLFPFAYAHGLRTLWITCAPDNMPSRRTCEIAGGEYMGTIRVPKGTELYARGRRHVRRYKFNLKNIADTAGKIPAFTKKSNCACNALCVY